MNRAAIVVASLIALAGVSGMAHSAVIGFEDFQGGSINLSGTANVFDFGAGGGVGGDVFGRVSRFDGGSGTGGPFDVWDDSVADTSGGGAPFPADVLGVAGQNTEAFFALNDADGLGGLNNATWTFDISSALAITSIDIDQGAMGDFELGSSDGYLIEARIDGNPYQTIFQSIPNETIDPYTYRPMDDGDVVSLNDPLELFIDGGLIAADVLDKSDPTTGAFDTYTSLLLAGGSGSTLDIRVSWAGAPSGSEPQAIDNITVNGVVIPEPASVALLLLAGVGLAFGRRGR